MAQLLQILDPISLGSTQEESGYQICRFCLENSANYINLLEKCGEEISTFLQTYHIFKIDPCDSWPKSACLSCVSRITSFRTLCETIRNSEEALRQIFGDSSNNVCIKKEEEDDVFSESFPESFPEALPECFPTALPESFPESVMETKIEEKLPLEQKLNEIEEFYSMTCDLCQKEFIRSSDLHQHFRQKHKTRWYIRCCKIKLRVKSEMLDHLEYHRNPDSFKCPHCLKQLTSQLTKSRHIANFHMPEKRIFMCDICEKSYAVKTLLRRHIEERHLKIRPVPKKRKIIGDSPLKRHKPLQDCICETCGKHFERMERLKIHMKIHALGPNGEPLRNFKCEVCGNTYKTKTSLGHHKKMHNPYGTYKCKECGKVSPTPNALKKHMKDSHKLTRAFICHICHKGFKRKIGLMEHVATHTGEYLYTCDHCPKQFRAAATKSQHVSREHPEMRKRR